MHEGRFNLQRKMITGYVLIMLVGALFAGLLFFLRFQIQTDDNIEAQMRLTARLFGAELDKYGIEDAAGIVDTVEKISGMRATVIAFDGSVAADSQDSLQNHRDRPEVSGAFKFGEAIATRKSDTTAHYYKYFAGALQIDGEDYVIRIAKELHPLNQVGTRLFFLGLLIAVAISLVFAWISVVKNISNIRRLQQIRSEFVSNVTHELKTPLTSIKGFVDTLKQGAIGDEAVAEHFLDIIDIEADRLTALINDIMELSEIETMRGDKGISDYIIDDIIGDVVSIITPGAEKNGIKLTVRKSPAVSIVRINRDRLKQLLINLLDNSIKYSNPGGSVILDCELSGNNVIFTVSDDGIGIAAEHLARIFERFYRVDKGRSRKRGGTGLGLSIVKHIVELYRGDISVKSVEGQGTTFVATLPIAVQM